MNSEMDNGFSLAEWRRTIAELYAEIRRTPSNEIETVWGRWRTVRDELFRSHDQSPLDRSQRQRFRELPYYPYDPHWRIKTRPEPCPPDVEPRSVELPEGSARLRPIALLPIKLPADVPVGERDAAVPEQMAHLTVYWIEGYGGGLFLPFGDATNRTTTYGGGRYLYDTIKGADLGSAADELVLDFNFAYNPSCAYNPRWVCPLPPSENRLPFPVSAGEQYPAIQ